MSSTTILSQVSPFAIDEQVQGSSMFLRIRDNSNECLDSGNTINSDRKKGGNSDCSIKCNNLCFHFGQTNTLSSVYQMIASDSMMSQVSPLAIDKLVQGS